MGKQSKQPTYISQEQFDKDLDSSLNILIEDGADDKTISIYIDDYKSRYAVKKKRWYETQFYIYIGFSKTGFGTEKWFFGYTSI